MGLTEQEKIEGAAISADQAEEYRLVQAVPGKRQEAYMELEFYGFIHYTVNTFTGMEWGDGTESETVFGPECLDAGQWARAAHDGGMKGLILTCKHHDGFCLWPSKFTEHSVKNSPFRGGKGDAVRETADACRAYGLKFGVYLSPWDRNHPAYGSGKAYDDYFVNQLTELLTEYGEIFTVWLDGACGEGPDGRRQVYDWKRYYAVIRRLQPDAVISVSGPDVRWCGNEAGITRESEWSVVSSVLADPELTARYSQKKDAPEFRSRPLDKQRQDLGSRSVLQGEPELVFYPAEVDVSIRPGWFYHPEEDGQVMTLERLKEIYLKSVGGNASLLLNLPPMPCGLLNERDVEVLKQLGSFIRGAFGEPLAFWRAPEPRDDGCRDSISLEWGRTCGLGYLVLQEDLRYSQRVEAFCVECLLPQGIWQEVCRETVIGHKRIVSLAGISAAGLRVRVTECRLEPHLKQVCVYGECAGGINV